jgi:hypothetical protein
MKMHMENNQDRVKSKFNGAIPLLRKFQQHPFWTEKRKYSRAEAWIDLLFMARYGTETEERWDRGELIQIEYAQILTSILTLAHRWGKNRGWVRKFIKILEIKQSISVITMNNRRTILQIVNMGQIKELLQNKVQQNIHQNEQQMDSRMTHKNKDNEINKEIIKNGNLTNEILSLFSKINPSYKLLYSNTTERNSLDRLIDQYGEEKIRNLISKLPSIVYQPYAPQITTPFELEKKMGKLLIYMQQEENKKVKGGVTKV